MALYAFDGTWNADRDRNERDTNVRLLFDLSAEPDTHKLYTAGVGTKFKRIGQLIGGMFGAGSFSRVAAAYDHLRRTYRPGDPIDVIGFSRGASLALDFVNRIVDRRGTPGAPQPTIRFIGLFDVVGSFGIPFNVWPFRFQTWNVGHKLTLPAAHVQHCYHALALDERRQTFALTRIAGAHEVWFRGVHSDIGGGNGNTKLSFIALRWMLRKALAAGVPMDLAAVEALSLDAGIDSTAPLSLPLDLAPNDFRRCLAADRRHYTVAPPLDRPDRDRCNPAIPGVVETEIDEIVLQPAIG